MVSFSDISNYWDNFSSKVTSTMEYDYFVGCILIAYSFPFALLVFFIIPKAQLVVISFTSCIFYILAIMINSVLWKLLPFLQASSTFFVLISVMIIEAIRCIYFTYFDRGRRTFVSVATNRVIFPIDDLTSSIAGGFGWGIVHILFYYGNIISKSLGPGTYFDSSCESISVITKATWFAFAFFMINVFLMIIIYDAFKTRNRLQWFLSIFIHVFTSLMPLFEIDCLWIIVGEIAFVIGLGVWSWILINRPQYRWKLKQL